MFRTSKCSPSGRLVHAVLWYFFHASIQAVWSMKSPTIEQNAYMDVEDTIIKLKKYCKKSALCWFLLHYVYHKTRFKKLKVKPLRVSYKIQMYKHVCYLSLEAFAATEFNEIFSGRQPHHDVMVLRRFGSQPRPHLQGELWDGVISRNGGKISQFEAAVCPRKFN